MALLTVKDLNVFYGNIHAIKGISFEVNDAAFGVIGFYSAVVDLRVIDGGSAAVKQRGNRKRSGGDQKNHNRRKDDKRRFLLGFHIHSLHYQPFFKGAFAFFLADFRLSVLDLMVRRMTAVNTSISAILPQHRVVFHVTS